MIDQNPHQREPLPDDPQATLEHIRMKMESVAADFANGTLNRAQFNAIYAHYSDQRTLIERLIERNPGNNAWRQAAAPGHTGFLRSHFEAQPIFYVVFRHNDPRPLITGGEEPSSAREQVVQILKALWRTPEQPPRTGLARKAMADNAWMVIAVGELAVTIIVYSLQPSASQQNLARDLHHDFERANRTALQRGSSADRMVFPQRALTI